MASRNLLEQIMQSITGQRTRSSGVSPATISGDFKEVASTIHRLDHSNSNIAVDYPKKAGGGMSDFDPKSLLAGDVVMIALIAAAMQFNLIPTFEIDLKTVTQQEIIHAISTTSRGNSSGQPEHMTKKVYPTLSFTDSRKEFSITFSVVTIFEELVIYAAKSLMNTPKTISAVKSVSKPSLPVKKKSMISTLYLNPGDFIFSSVVDEKENITGGFQDDYEVYEMTDYDFLRDDKFQYNKGIEYMDVTSNNDSFSAMKNIPIFMPQNTQKSTEKKSIKNGLAKELIGSFDVHFYELTARISTTLLRPLLCEKQVPFFIIYFYSVFYLYYLIEIHFIFYLFICLFVYFIF